MALLSDNCFNVEVTLRQVHKGTMERRDEETWSQLWSGNRWRADQAQSSPSSGPGSGARSSPAPVQSWLWQDSGIPPLAFLSLGSPGFVCLFSYFLKCLSNRQHSASSSWLSPFDSRDLGQGK